MPNFPRTLSRPHTYHHTGTRTVKTTSLILPNYDLTTHLSRCLLQSFYTPSEVPHSERVSSLLANQRHDTPALQIAVPESHLIAAKAFAIIYNIGLVTQPPLSLLISGIPAYLAYHRYHAGPRNSKLWAMSRTWMATILPSTFGLIELASNFVRATLAVDAGAIGM